MLVEQLRALHHATDQRELARLGRRLNGNVASFPFLLDTDSAADLDEGTDNLELPRRLQDATEANVEASLEALEGAVPDTVVDVLRDRSNKQSNLRSSELADVFFDAGMAAGYLIRAALALRGAVVDCPLVDEKNQETRMICSVDIFGLLNSFAGVVAHLSSVIGSAPASGLNVATFCAADIGDLVLGVTDVGVVGSSLKLTCGHVAHDVVADGSSLVDGTSGGQTVDGSGRSQRRLAGPVHV